MTEVENKDFFCKVSGRVKVKVKVDNESWVVVWRKKYQINFELFELPPVLIAAAKQYLRSRLSNTGPFCIDTIKRFLRFLSANWNQSWVDLSDIKLIDLMALWNLPPVRGRTVRRLEFKRFYKYCCDESLSGADVFVSGEITSWIANIDTSHYNDLLTWHEERGAMTTSEQELLRRFLQSADEGETVNERFTRIFLLACFETIKRPSQILEMKSDALVEILSEGKDNQYFLRVPKAKKQLGRKAELWPITNSLAFEIIKYSALKKVSSAQEKFDLLLVRDGTQEALPRYNVSSLISRWVRVRNIVSPRTNRLLVVTPYRIRHTGATALAMQGTSTAEIQYILEHDSPFASQAYIDAIGSELAPLLSKIDRKVGYIFTKLNDGFFKGSVQNYLLDKKVLIPVVHAPAVVGSCGFNGRCDKHPFFQCYNGCRYFIAWRDADHSGSLAYVENELARWESAEGLNERSKAIKDFERVRVAITDVINRIDKNHA
jgi:hypothetical protein